MPRSLEIVFLVAALFGIVGQSCAQEILFASAEDSRSILSARDEFVSRMSPFDRASRMKTDREVTEAEFLAFAASAALDWDPAEIQAIEAILETLMPAISALSLPLPETVYLIKTTGEEEGHAGYTRQNAVVLPRRHVSAAESGLKRLLAHELFHVASRATPELAKSLYPTIGFDYCGEVEFPASLASRKITNPDAPRNDYCIQLQLGSENILAIPILFSTTPGYDVSRGGEFFQYLKLALLLVEQPAGSGVAQGLHDANGPRLAEIQQVTGYFEKVGNNTDYIIHPEEILASNFALLATGLSELKSPEVLTRLQSALAAFGSEH